jgi:hypothetical protein
MHLQARTFATAILLGLLGAGAGTAQLAQQTNSDGATVPPGATALYYPQPAIGSTNIATADPPVPHPDTKPCVVTLFTNDTFSSYYDATDFSYTPPSDCRGPWAKVVLEADFSIDAGSQYDREGHIMLGGATLYHGTESEPNLDGISVDTWHVENDVTDYSALLREPNTGFAEISNIGPPNLHGSASLYFYPARFGEPVPVTPDAVYPVPTTGDLENPNTAAITNQVTLSLPRNVERAYLALTARGDGSDEFWWINSTLREGEISIDGTPAGVLPIYPYVYTGGGGPTYWQPTPGVQALNFVPYKVDLTPFAGLLSNGQSHTVAVSILGNQGFDVHADLLIYQDHGRSEIEGETTQNTLTATPVVTTNTTSTATTVTSSRDFTISGWVNTSHGRVVTTLKQNIAFSNVNGATAVQQSTTGTLQTTVQDGWSVQESTDTFSWPFEYNGSFQMGYQNDLVNKWNGWKIYSSSVSNNTQNSSSGPGQQTYSSKDSRGYCYDRMLTINNNAITGVTDGTGCPTVPHGW